MRNGVVQDINYHLEEKNKYFHAVMYSPCKDEVVLMFSDMTDTFSAHEALDRVNVCYVIYIRISRSG